MSIVPILPALIAVIVAAVAVIAQSGQQRTVSSATLAVTPVAAPSTHPSAGGATGWPSPSHQGAAAAGPPRSASTQPSPPVDEDAVAECERQRRLLGGMLNPYCVSLLERRSSAAPTPTPTPAATVSGQVTPQPRPSDATQMVEWACDNNFLLMASTNPVCILKDINEGLSSAVAEMTVWLASKIGEALEATGELDLTQAWFAGVFSSISSIAALIALIAVLLSVMAAALFRDPGEIMRTLLKVLTAGVSTGMVVIVVAKANQLIDAFCLYLLGPGGWKEVTDSLMVPATKLDNWIGMAAPLAPTGVMLLIAIGMILAFLVLWVEMLIRRLLLDICVMMWPLVVSGAVWSGARPMTRRLIDSIIALEIMKLIVVAIFKMAANMLRNIDSIDEMALALVLYWLAAFSPFMVMRLIGLVSGGLNPGATGEGVREALAGAAGAMLARGRRLAGGTARGLGSTAAMRGGGRTPMPDIAGGGAPAKAGEQEGGAQANGEGAPNKIRPIPAHLLKAFGIQPAARADTGADAGANSGSKPAGDSGGQPAGSTGAPGAEPSSQSPLKGNAVAGDARPTPPPAATPAASSRPGASTAPARSTPPSPPVSPAAPPPAGTSPPSGRPAGTSWGRLPQPLPPPVQSDALPTYDDVPPPPPVALPPVHHQPEIPDLDPPEPS
ncbi:hypothetical protein [Nonomuraea sp. SYSU D8015]|uniref:hypothetical protein n=1 Tax=Nonomuraea sp. SYSU D8015 TaxID=2593644 RepID=UPI0016601C31|nr:hypothetical protein [Nonomuraea sp. SYSU D8015]